MSDQTDFDLGPILPDAATVLDEEIDGELTDGAELPNGYGVAPLFNFDPAGTPGFEQRGAQGLITITDDQRGLLVWIQKAVRTPRGQYAIYDENYGTDLAADLGTLGFGALIQNTEQDLKRCLLMHPLIEDVQDVTVMQTDEPDSCLITMTIIDRLAGPIEVQVTV